MIIKKSETIKHLFFPRNKTSLILTTIGLFLFFLTNATYYHYYFDSIGNLFSIVAILCLILSVALSGRIVDNTIFWFVIIAWIASNTIPSVISGFSREFFVKTIYWIALVFAISSSKFSGYNFKKSIFLISKIFLCWSFLNYFVNLSVYSFLPVTAVSEKLMYNWLIIDCRCFVFFKNYSYFTVGSISIPRLSAPFGEPGIAQIYFNYGLIYCLFFHERKFRLHWILLFSSAIIMCLSFIGLIAFVAIVFIYLIMKKRYVSSFAFALAFSFAVAIMMIEKVSSFSYVDRTSDFVFTFENIGKFFPFGTGIGNLGTIETNQVVGYDVKSVGFYCGLLLPLLLFGMFSVVYYILLFNSFIYFSKNKNANFIFGIFIALTLLTEPQNNEFFVICFIISGIYDFCYAKNKIVNEYTNSRLSGEFK